MRILLDEGLPVQLLDPLRRNRGHEFAHVDGVGWKGKRDTNLFKDAAAKGYDAIVALDLDQLVDPEEWRALRDAGPITSALGRAGGCRVRKDSPASWVH